MITRTVWVYWLISALFRASIAFCLGYYVVFLKDSGLSDSQLMWPNIWFWLVNCVADTPTGVLADKFGRKISFLVACLLMAVGTGVYALASSLIFFFLAETILAIGATCESGAFDAWFTTKYRSELNNDQRYRKCLPIIDTCNELISNVASVVAAIIGTASSLLGRHTPYVLCMLLFVATGISAVMLMYSDRHRVQASHKLGLLKRLSLAIGTYRANRNLAAYALFGFVMVVAMQAPNMYWAVVLQPHLPVHLFGFAWMGIVLSCAVGTGLAALLAWWRGPEFGLFVKGVFTLISLIIAGMSGPIGVVVAGFLLHELGRGLYGSTRLSLVKLSVPKEDEAQQATILSLDSTVMNIGAVTGLVLGAVVVKFVTPQAVWAVIAMVAMVGLLALVRCRRFASV